MWDHWWHFGLVQFSVLRIVDSLRIPPVAPPMARADVVAEAVAWAVGYAIMSAVLSVAGGWIHASLLTRVTDGVTPGS